MTIAADAMAHVVSRMAPELAVADFRKRRHSFNRVTGDDLVHVVSFQMGPKLPPGATEVPPYRLDLYGKFTINIGVYVPHLALRLGRAPRDAWVNEYNCHFCVSGSASSSHPGSRILAPVAAQISPRASQHTTPAWYRAAVPTCAGTR